MADDAPSTDRALHGFKLIKDLRVGWGDLGSDLNRFFDFKDFAFSISMEIQLAFDFPPRFLAVRNGGVR